MGPVTRLEKLRELHQERAGAGESKMTEDQQRRKLSKVHERAVRRELHRIGRNAAGLTEEQRVRVLEAGVRAVRREVEVMARAGCVRLRRCRATGTLVGVYRSVEAGIETDPDLPWSTVCEEHHTVVCSATRRGAELAASYPDFCEGCQRKLR